MNYRDTLLEPIADAWLVQNLVVNPNPIKDSFVVKVCLILKTNYKFKIWKTQSYNDTLSKLSWLSLCRWNYDLISDKDLEDMFIQ